MYEIPLVITIKEGGVLYWLFAGEYRKDINLGDIFGNIIPPQEGVEVVIPKAMQETINKNHNEIILEILNKKNKKMAIRMTIQKGGIIDILPLSIV